MRILLPFLLVIVSVQVLAQPAFPDANLLDKDPVFRKILSRRLSYPFLNAQQGYTKLVYAQFEIDEQGHTQHVIIFNPALGKGYYYVDFDKAVEKALNKLPPLHPRYAGKYMLPVVFALNDYETGKLIIPDNTNFNGNLRDVILLKAITVVGYNYKSSQKMNVTKYPGP
jgi:hypothetical protein